MTDSAATHHDLVLGPVLRRVEGARATVWVETARAATVEVRAGAAGGVARTFAAHGHHYALVLVDGLPPGAATPYTVYLDGEQAWPREDDPYPPPVIRTRSAGAPVRLVFGSCRKSTPYSTTGYPPDALDAYAVRLAGQAPPAGNTANAAGPANTTNTANQANPTAQADQANPTDWPDLLVLLGDQVYADETPKKIRQWLRRRRRRPDAPLTQVVDFHEYTQLYLDSWTDPEIRWLMSTVPSVMIFDDHEIIDDWNVSASWRAEMSLQSWWPQRIRAGLSSYWVYQHLGNIPPSELAADPVYAAVISAQDATSVLDDFGTRADAQRHEYRWSYVVDLGRTRLIMLDNRCGRQLAPKHRAMLPDREWTWFTSAVPGDYDHLVIGSSLPWLMPPAIHHLEAANERLAESRRHWVASSAEWVRRAVDLEHWAAFGRSFEALTALLRQVAAGTGGVSPAPASVSVLSGDVHHSYVARALLDDNGSDSDSDSGVPVHQLTCSPVHNDVPRAIRPAMRLGWSPLAARGMRALARAAGLPPPSVRWRRVAGPYFGNAVGELIHSGRSARVTIEGTTPAKQLVVVAAVALTPGAMDPADPPVLPRQCPTQDVGPEYQGQRPEPAPANRAPT